MTSGNSKSAVKEGEAGKKGGSRAYELWQRAYELEEIIECCGKDVPPKQMLAEMAVKIAAAGQSEETMKLPNKMVLRLKEQAEAEMLKEHPKMPVEEDVDAEQPGDGEADLLSSENSDEAKGGNEPRGEWAVIRDKTDEARLEEGVAQEAQRYTGIIRMRSKLSGCGFTKSYRASMENGGYEMFLRYNGAPPAAVGNTVSFEVAPGQTGKPKAVSVQRQPVESPLIGTAKSCGKRGGFVLLGTLSEIYGADIFSPGRDRDQHELKVGDRVVCAARATGANKPEAEVMNKLGWEDEDAYSEDEDDEEKYMGVEE